MSQDPTQVWTRGYYEPIAQIGRGGMGEVLLAMFHAGGGGRRLAVLKRIWPALTTDPDFVSMFLDEARLALLLNHPNVVQTYEVIVADGELAIAMEYLEGQPLGRVLNRFRSAPDDLGLALRLRIIAGLLAGLEHAHTLTGLDGRPLGVVHRDVSPQNVFVTYEGQVKLVDFGVAKTLTALHETRAGAIKGKVAYMAPEQIRGMAVDHRADLFAVGVMLWEMLTGRRMWQGTTEIEIIGQHMSSTRLMPALLPDPSIPAELEAICARALEPDPDLRYQSAAEMELDLEQVLAGSFDSHPRQLGRSLAAAFAGERAERQAMVERYIREDDGDLTSFRRSTPNVVSTVERAPASRPAVLPASSAWRRAATTSGLVAATLLGVLVGGWRVEAARGSVAGRADGANRHPAPQIVPLADRPEPGSPPVSDGTPIRILPAIPKTGRSPEGAADDEPHRRHRRQRREADEDGTLPPSVDLTDP